MSGHQYRVPQWVTPIARWSWQSALLAMAICATFSVIWPIPVDAADGHETQSACSVPACTDVESASPRINDSSGAATARPWHFRRQLGRSTVEISVSWAACRRTVPKIKVRVVERPHRAVITTRVHVPARPPGTSCLRLRGRRSIRVRLGRPVAGLKLFDGSFSPPKLRWPK